MLVDQHADMDAGLQQPRQLAPARRGRSGSSSPISGARSLTMTSLIGADIRPPIEHGGMRAEHFCDDAPEVPSWRDGRQSRASACRRSSMRSVALRRFRRVGDDVRRLPADALDAEFIEVRELDRDAPEIVPHAGEDLLDLGVGFFRKGGAQVVAADAVFRKQRADLAHQRAGEVRRALAIHALDRAQERRRRWRRWSASSRASKRGFRHQSAIAL